MDGRREVLADKGGGECGFEGRTVTGAERPRSARSSEGRGEEDGGYKGNRKKDCAGTGSEFGAGSGEVRIYEDDGEKEYLPGVGRVRISRSKPAFRRSGKSRYWLNCPDCRPF